MGPSKSFCSMAHQTTLSHTTETLLLAHPALSLHPLKAKNMKGQESTSFALLTYFQVALKSTRPVISLLGKNRGSCCEAGKS